MIEIPAEKPSDLTGDWPGQYEVFSWLEFVVALPGLLHVVTTRKENGCANANFNAWMMQAGDADKFCSLIAILRHQHTYANIMREREWCINIPPANRYGDLLKTVHCHGEDAAATGDELARAGLTSLPSVAVKAPRMGEAGIILECKLEWERPLLDGSKWHLFCGKVLHVAMRDEVAVENPHDRLRALSPVYNVHSPLNPLTHRHGEFTPARLEC